MFHYKDFLWQSQLVVKSSNFPRLVFTGRAIFSDVKMCNKKTFSLKDATVISNAAEKYLKNSMPKLLKKYCSSNLGLNQ